MGSLDGFAEHMEDFFRSSIDESPNECIISGLKKCNEYMIVNEDQEAHVVYITNPAYDAYTMYSYDKDSMTFNREHFDLDEGVWRDSEYLDLYDVLDHPRLSEIMAYYGISLNEINTARDE